MVIYIVCRGMDKQGIESLKKAFFGKDDAERYKKDCEKEEADPEIYYYIIEEVMLEEPK